MNQDSTPVPSSLLMALIWAKNTIAHNSRGQLEIAYLKVLVETLENAGLTR